jgi:hypothetical protein
MNPKNPNPLHAVESGIPEKGNINRPGQSPYLKAILSGASRAFNAGKMIRMIDDRTAASRYIRQSSFLRG